MREPGCDNQEIKNKNPKKSENTRTGEKKLDNRETLLLLLHSSCFLLFYVSSSSGGGGGDGGESYSHLKWTEGRRGGGGGRRVKNTLKPVKCSAAQMSREQNMKTKPNKKRQRVASERAGIKKQSLIPSRRSRPPGAAGNWDTL